jgi:hypothetical protein
MRINRNFLVRKVVVITSELLCHSYGTAGINIKSELFRVLTISYVR